MTKIGWNYLRWILRYGVHNFTRFSGHTVTYSLSLTDGHTRIQNVSSSDDFRWLRHTNNTRKLLLLYAKRASIWYWHLTESQRLQTQIGLHAISAIKFSEYSFSCIFLRITSQYSVTTNSELQKATCSTLLHGAYKLLNDEVDEVTSLLLCHDVILSVRSDS